MIKRLVCALAFFVAALAGAADGPAGGIADQPCANVAGENTNSCPAGEVGTPYSLRFVEEEGSGCGPGEQTFHLDSGLLPPQLTLAADGTLSGIPTQIGTFKFYVEMREPQDDPANCAGKRTQKQFALKICDHLGITSSPAPAPRAEARVPFRMALSWCGGVGESTWTVSTGDLPAGLTLSRVGSLRGVHRDGDRRPATHGESRARDLRRPEPATSAATRAGGESWSCVSHEVECDRWCCSEDLDCRARAPAAGPASRSCAGRPRRHADEAGRASHHRRGARPTRREDGDDLHARRAAFSREQVTQSTAPSCRPRCTEIGWHRRARQEVDR